MHHHMREFVDALTNFRTETRPIDQLAHAAQVGDEPAPQLLDHDGVGEQVLAGGVGLHRGHGIAGGDMFVDYEEGNPDAVATRFRRPSLRARSAVTSPTR